MIKTIDGSFVPYTTVGPTRWDTVASWAYSDPGATDQLVYANPTLSPVLLIPSGVTVLCPVLASETTAFQLLPPWA